MKHDHSPEDQLQQEHEPDSFIDLQLLHESRERYEHRALIQIRKDAADPYNRLQSIAEDAEFVRYVHEVYSSLQLVRE